VGWGGVGWGGVLACLSEVAAPGKVAVILRLLCGAARAVPPAPGSLRCRRSGLAVPSSSAGRAGLAWGSVPPPGISPRRSRLWSAWFVPGILARRAAGEPRHVPSRPGRSCSARPGSPAVAAEAFTSARPAFEDTPAGRPGPGGLPPAGPGRARFREGAGWGNTPRPAGAGAVPTARRPEAGAAVRSQRSAREERVKGEVRPAFEDGTRNPDRRLRDRTAATRRRGRRPSSGLLPACPRGRACRPSPR
jgi:hypothetical protein